MFPWPARMNDVRFTARALGCLRIECGTDENEHDECAEHAECGQEVHVKSPELMSHILYDLPRSSMT